MDKVAITKSLLDNLADHINAKAGTTGPKTIEQMQNTVDGIDTSEPMQEKSVEITENGTTVVTPDTGYGGMSKVSISTNVPMPAIQDVKRITVTSNEGVTKVLPDDGYEAIQAVLVFADIPIEGNEIMLALSMADGDQVLTADEGQLYSKVTIVKPDTMLPENIKSGVIIAGITGTYAGGGSGEQPQLFAPAIALDVYQLTITNNSQNGGFLPTSYEGFVNGVSVGTIPCSGDVTTIDTSSFAETSETSVAVTVTAKRDDFRDSQPSNAVNWERYYTVTFYDGDTVLKTGLVQNGVTVFAAQPSTQKTGYSFVGWFSDSALTEVVDETTAVESDMVLYGEWVESVYVSLKGDAFNLPSGSNSIAVSPDGSAIAVPDQKNYKIHLYKATSDGVRLEYSTDFGSAITGNVANRVEWLTNDIYVVTGVIYNNPPCLVYKPDFNTKKSTNLAAYTSGLPIVANTIGSILGNTMVITGSNKTIVLDVTTSPFTVLYTYTYPNAGGISLLHGVAKSKLSDSKYVIEKDDNVYIFDFNGGSYTNISTTISSAHSFSGGVGNAIAALKSASELEIYDGNFEAIKHTVPVSSADHLVVNKDGKAIVSVSGGLQVIDINDGSTVQTVGTETHANYLNLGQDWRTLYCGNTTSGVQTAYSLKYESVDQA